MNINIFNKTRTCPKCGSEMIRIKDKKFSLSLLFRKTYQCTNCKSILIGK